MLSKIRENARVFLDEGRILPFVKLFRDQLWPGGKLRPSGMPRTSEEKIWTRDEANRKLSSLIPGMATSTLFLVKPTYFIQIWLQI